MINSPDQSCIYKKGYKIGNLPFRIVPCVNLPIPETNKNTQISIKGRNVEYRLSRHVPNRAHCRETEVKSSDKSKEGGARCNSKKRSGKVVSLRLIRVRKRL
jgi:hypothetical protein